MKGGVMRIGVLAFAAASLLVFPSVTYAGNAYSAWMVNHVVVDGINRDSCIQAGIEDFAINLSYEKARQGFDSCALPLVTMPTGWIGVQVWGYRDGSVCAQSAFWYSNAPSTSWWVRQQLCSNPAGTQEFKTRAFGALFDGDFYQWWLANSPIQNY